MELTHRFTVPTSVEETWSHFGDIEGLAQCFPGATVTSVDGGTFQGTCKVKLGPIALVYSGSGTFVDKDEQSHSFKVNAKGKDKRGNGTAGAKVDLSMTASGDGDGTDVQVLTDLAITGKPAQFGRGVMQDVSDKLLGQFVTCLEQRLSGPVERAQPAPAAPASAEHEPDVVAAVGAEPTAPDPVARLSSAGPSVDDSLDLGATVIPVLLRSYGPQVAAGVGVLALLVWLVRRR